MAVSDPLVSVVIPTCNRAMLLERAIRSVLGQSYANLELIVIDDASTDTTPELVRRFDDPRFRYFRMEHNQGAAGARNAAVAASRGPLLAFLDDDDFWLPERLARHVPALLAAPDDTVLSLCSHVQLYYTRATYVGGPRHFDALRFDRGPFGDFSLVATPGWLIRREHFEASGGFDPRMRCWDDWELALRLRKAGSFHAYDEVLWVQDRRRPGGMFDNRRKFANDVAVLIEKHGSSWPPAVRSRQWHLAGLAEAATVGPAAAREPLRRATQDNPWNVQAWAARGLACLGQPAWRAGSRLWQRLGNLRRRFR